MVGAPPLIPLLREKGNLIDHYGRHSNSDRARGGKASRAGLIQGLRSGDTFAHLFTLLCAASILLVTVALVHQLYVNSTLPLHKFGFRFLTGRTWDPVSGDFGALPFIYGTLVTSALALLVAVPMGVGAAIFLSELAPPRISNAMTFVIELLAAVPSVIYGLLGIFVMVPSSPPIWRAVPEAHLGIPAAFSGADVRRGNVGGRFGAGHHGRTLHHFGSHAKSFWPFRWSNVRRPWRWAPPSGSPPGRSWSPYARIGIMASIFLALARALGETMAVTMVIGNDPKISASLFAPAYSIAAVIANEFTEATGDLYLQALIELGLVLFALTIVINGLARVLLFPRPRRGRGINGLAQCLAEIRQRTSCSA